MAVFHVDFVLFFCAAVCFALVSSQDTSFDTGNQLLEVTAKTHNISDTTKFLIFEVNPGEGFNLRRDVYIRVANLINRLNDEKGQHWILVLPPWRHLYHWKSRYLRQDAEPWANFFNVPSLNLYVPVMEFHDFIKISGSSEIDYIMYLQRHPDGFKGGWKEVINVDECAANTPYRKNDDGVFKSYFWGYSDVYGKKFDCISVQGHATILADFMKKSGARSFLVDRFEQVLHLEFGSTDFYKARRSLVFATHLRDEGDKFRKEFLQSDDEKDKTPYTEDWQNQVPKEGSAIGGPYLGVHMRRGDFTYAHKETVPSIEELGGEIAKKLKEYKLKKVYLATDGSDQEITQLQSHFNAKIYRFPRSEEEVKKYRDGGIAIIDQWIVAHARYFIGTCSSTFSFRIYEEREILGLDGKTTYNCICGKQSPEGRCETPGSWKVKFG